LIAQHWHQARHIGLQVNGLLRLPRDTQGAPEPPSWRTNSGWQADGRVDFEHLSTERLNEVRRTTPACGWMG
jgi:hypothetical protein